MISNCDGKGYVCDAINSVGTSLNDLNEFKIYVNQTFNHNVPECIKKIIVKKSNRGERVVAFSEISGGHFNGFLYNRKFPKQAVTVLK